MRENSSCNNWGKTLSRSRDDCLCHPLVPTQGLSHPARARRSTSGPSHYPHNTGPSFRRNENERSIQLETWEGRKEGGREELPRTWDRDVPHYESEAARTSVTSLEIQELCDEEKQFSLPATVFLWWTGTEFSTSEQSGIFEIRREFSPIVFRDGDVSSRRF